MPLTSKVNRSTVWLAGGMALCTVLAAALASPARAARPLSYALSGSGEFTVTVRGNGHGHGLSQYGARGAADAGLSTAQILRFYYPGTTLTTLPSARTLRVLLSGGYAKTCVQAKPGLRASGVAGRLPTSGSLQVTPSGNGLALRSFASPHCSAPATKSWTQPTAARIVIASADGLIRLRRADGTSTDYYGTLGAVRSGSGVLTINTVGLDKYAQGVAPREMPASWNIAAVRAQAIAARTYAEFERQHAAAGDAYDLCDTSSCQVYGGHAHYAAGTTTAVWQDDPEAIGPNSRRVVTYRGAVIFAQYSASNGGRLADGGKPYLVAKTDPYDSAASGDPFLAATKTVSNSTLARAFGLKSVSAVDVTGRDASGVGYVTSAVVHGVTSAGVAASLSTTGSTLQSAMGLSSSYFKFGASSRGGSSAMVAPILVVAGSRPRVAQLRWSAITGATRYHLFRNGKSTPIYVGRTSVTVRQNGVYSVVAMADARGNVHSSKSNKVRVSGLPS